MEMYCYKCLIPLTTSHQYIQCIKNNCYNHFCLSCISNDDFSFNSTTFLYDFNCIYCNITKD